MAPSRSPITVLVTGFPDPVGEHITNGLEGAGLDVTLRPFSDGTLLLLEGRRFDVIVVGHPLPGAGFGQLLSSVRAHASACRRSGLVVLVPPEDVRAVERLIGRGVNRVLADNVSISEILDAVESVHDVAPRHKVRLPVQLEVNLPRRMLRALCQTEDISESGMLLRGFRHYPPGTVFSFEIRLPGEPVTIKGQAEIARNTDVERETMQGFGARFIDISDGDMGRLASLLDRIGPKPAVN